MKPAHTPIECCGMKTLLYIVVATRIQVVATRRGLVEI